MAVSGATGEERAAAQTEVRPPLARLRLPLPAWGAMLVVGWLLFAVTTTPDTMMGFPYYLPRALDSFVTWLRSLLPARWESAPMSDWGARTFTILLYVATVTGIWLIYRLAIRSAERKAPGDSAEDSSAGRGRAAWVLAGTVVFGLLTFFWWSLHSSDIYLYAVQGKMQAVHHLDPFRYTPHSMRPDPLVSLTPWESIPSAYGPVWLFVAQWVSAAVEAIGGTVARYVVAFKLLGLTALLVSAWILWAITGQLGWRQRRRVPSLLLFAWCPLTVIDLAGNAHNDALLILFILLAVWLHLRGWWPAAIAALMLGALVKLPGYFVLPAYGVLLARTSDSRAQAVRRLGAGLGVAAVVGGLAYLPHWYSLPSAITSNPLAGFFGPSAGLVVRQIVVDLAGAFPGSLAPAGMTTQQITDAVSMPIWYGALAVWAIFALYFSLQPRDFASLIRSWALVLFSYLVVGSVWFMPWYVTWLLPLAALLSPGHLRRAILLLAWGATLFYTVTPRVPGDTTENLQSYYVPAVIFLPALLYLAWAGLTGRARSGEGRPTPAPQQRSLT